MSLLSLQPSPGSETRHSGELVPERQPGSLFCVGCGWAFSIASVERLPQCPNCGSADFRRASLFDSPTMETGAVECLERPPEWLEEARAEVDQPGSFIAFSDGDEIAVIHLEPGWTRIGRSGAADIRIDDPTVSRRHALLVLTDDGDLRALDDRSLNGLFVNGEAVEWAALGDGDELEIGRYRLHVLRV